MATEEAGGAVSEATGMVLAGRRPPSAGPLEAPAQAMLADLTPGRSRGVIWPKRWPKRPTAFSPKVAVQDARSTGGLHQMAGVCKRTFVAVFVLEASHHPCAFVTRQICLDAGK
mmetsp:Transcript_53407/g.74042  ORF Transcript_53407/g.74042 Transcript_53407/m.74042 type:complete len:114 (+) Transcript_53407:537-878(+)